MRFALRSALKDLKRQAADPVATLLWFGIPLAIAFMIVLAFGGKEAKAPVAELLVTDLDSTFVSGLMIQALGNTPVIQVESVGRDEGRNRIEKGRGSAFLVLPKGFSDAVLNRTPMTLNLVTNPAQNILPGIIEETLSMFVDGVFYLQETMGDRLNDFLAAENPSGGFDSATIAAFAVTLNDLTRKADSTLFPPVLKLTMEKPPEEKEKGPGFGILFFPGILFMSLLFMGQGIAGDMWIEKKNGTLRRAVTSPGGAEPLLAGKILSGALMATGVSGVAMAFGHFWFGIPLNRIAGGMAWAVFSGAVFLSLLILIQMMASTQKAGNLLTSFILFPLLMLGGSFFPFEAMPSGMAAIGKWTPNGWALHQLKMILLGTADRAGLLAALAGLLAAGILAFLISSRRLRRFATEAS